MCINVKTNNTSFKSVVKDSTFFANYFYNLIGFGVSKTNEYAFFTVSNLDIVA